MSFWRSEKRDRAAGGALGSISIWAEVMRGPRRPRQAGPAGALQAMAARQCRSMYWRCEGRGPCRLLEGLPQPGKQPRRVDMGAQIDQRIVVLGPDLRDCAVGIFPQRACSGPAERAEYVCALLPEYVCGPL